VNARVVVVERRMGDTATAGLFAVVVFQLDFTAGVDFLDGRLAIVVRNEHVLIRRFSQLHPSRQRGRGGCRLFGGGWCFAGGGFFGSGGRLFCGEWRLAGGGFFGCGCRLFG